MDMCIRKRSYAWQQWVLDAVLHVSQEAVVLPAIVLGVACVRGGAICVCFGS